MSILGTVIRTHPRDVAVVADRLSALPGLDLSLNPGDGRLVAVIEDAEGEHGPVAAAATLAAIAQWPEVMSTSLVYEYSGPDAPAPAGAEGTDFKAWRQSLADMAAGSPAAPSP